MPRLGLAVYHEPSACGCKLEYDAVAANVVEPCAVHAPAVALNGPGWTVVQKVLGHNARWQRAMNEELATRVAACSEPVFDESGAQIGVRFKRGTATWSIDPATGVMTITLIGVSLTGQQRNALRNALSGRFGTEVVLG